MLEIRVGAAPDRLQKRHLGQTWRRCLVAHQDLHVTGMWRADGARDHVMRGRGATANQQHRTAGKQTVSVEFHGDSVAPSGPWGAAAGVSDGGWVAGTSGSGAAAASS